MGMVTLVTNEWPRPLDEMEPCAVPCAATLLFERRLDVLILIATICFLGATVVIACVQVKNRLSVGGTRWDPPAGVINKKVIPTILFKDLFKD